jgi:hypothetical protein
MRSPSGRRVAACVAACAAALVVLVAGCGADGVEPDRWATRVCRVMKPWSEEIAGLTRDTQAEMSRAVSAEQARSSIVELLRGAEEASERARQRVAAAGVPAVDEGERIAAEFRAALRAARDAYGSARRRVAALSIRSPDTFYDRVVEAMRTLSSNYDDGALDTGELASEELRRAFDESPECR